MAVDPMPLWMQHMEVPSEDTLEALYLNYEPLARYLAQRALAKAPPYQDREDILSYAHHGLLDAIHRFEPQRGLKFETYATRRITGAIIDGQRKQDPLSRAARKRVKDLLLAQSALAELYDREPTLEEIALEMDTDVEEVRQILVTQKSVNASIEVMLEPERGAHDVTLNDNMVIGPDESSLELQSITEALSLLLSRLPDRDRAFMVFHYCERRSLRDTAKELGVTEVRTGQLRKEIFRSIRAA